MSNKRTIFIEAALVIGVLTTGIAAANSANASPVAAAIQSAGDPRANVKIESEVQVERTSTDAAGNEVTTLSTPADVKVIPGDRLVFTNSYKNTGKTAVTGFVVNNPVHPAVAFSEVSEPWALVSVDGGKKYGKLTDLTVVEEVVPATDSETPAAGTVTRPAQPNDVTHIRWVFAQAIAPGQTGALKFRGVVK